MGQVEHVWFITLCSNIAVGLKIENSEIPNCEVELGEDLIQLLFGPGCCAVNIVGLISFKALQVETSSFSRAGTVVFSLRLQSFSIRQYKLSQRPMYVYTEWIDQNGYTLPTCSI